MSDRNMFLAQYGHEGHIDHAINNSHDQNTIETALTNPLASKEHFDNAVNSEQTYVRQAVAKNPSLPKHHIDKLVDDWSDDVRMSVAANPNLHKEHIDKLSTDESHWVTSQLVKHPKLSIEQAKTSHKNLVKKNSMFADSFRTAAKHHHGYDI